MKAKDSILKVKPTGCMLSRISGRHVTHKVIENWQGQRKIVSAMGYRQDKQPVFYGTYSQCEYFLQKGNF